MSAPGRPVTAALAGAVCISTSAIVMKLAGSSPSATALGRCGFALPVLALLTWLERRRRVRAADGDAADGAALSAAALSGAALSAAGAMSARGRWLARLAGVFLAGDLILWSHSISNIGAGLATVLSNLQVIIVPLLGWLLLGERPRRSLLIAAPVMLFGLILVGGLVTGGGYGSDPGLGVAFGVGVGVLYSGYILLLRQATASPGGRGGPVVEALFEATVGAAAGALILGLLLRDFRLGPAWPTLGWLVVLALTSGVLGWLLITVSLPQLPAWLVSALLLVQPAGTAGLGAVFLRERPSLAQLGGVAAMLVGVLIATGGPASAREARATYAADAKARIMNGGG